MKRTMGNKMRVFVFTIVGAAVAFGIGVVQAQTPEQQSPNYGWRPPSEAERCPSKWGADDRRGAANHMGPESVMRATRLIRTGQTFDLGQPLKAGEMPLIGNRRWDMQITHSGRPLPPFDPSNPARQNFGFTETLWTAIGQVGTQLDGFGHQGLGDSFYNCVKVADVASNGGIDTIGPDVFGTLMTRGVLIDVAALKGVDELGDTYAITAQDLQDALARQNVSIQPGDAVLIRTGWGKYWTEDPVKYLHSSPGLRLDAEEWLVEQDPMIVASDNCCVEVRPVGVGPLIHQFFIVVHGLVVIENLKLDELAAAGANEFAFVVQPLPMWGATGSTVAPTALR